MTSAPAPRRGSMPLGVALGVVTGLVITGLAWVMLGLGSGTPGATASPTSPTAATTPTATSAPPSTAAEEPPASPSPTPADTDGIVTSLPAGSWVTVLKSLPQEVVTAENALEQAASLGNAEYQAIVIDTNEFDTLNRGYWAIVIPGQSSRAESNAVCEALGIGLGNDCYPREV
ncbi:MAG: hypothetical protein ACK5LS_07555 [Propioniciclava sp.]